MPRRLLATLFLALALGSGSACGGGGGGGGGAGAPPSTGAQALPPRIPLVPLLAGALPPAAPPAAPVSVPPDSDYLTDAQVVRLYDPALERLGRIERLLCLLGRAGTGTLLNAGDYAAVWTGRPCDGTGAGAALRTRGRSFLAGAGEPELWTLVSSRPAGAPSHRVLAWAPAAGDSPRLTIEAEVTRAPDGADPFGTFALHFVETDSGGAQLSAGTLAAEKDVAGLHLRYFEARGDVQAVPAPQESAEEVQAHVRLDADLQRGEARVFRRTRSDDGGGDTGIVPEQYLLAFDPAWLLRAHDGLVAVSHDRTRARANATRYALYHAAGPLAGTRVEPAAGFGFRTAGGAFGWADREGLAVPEGTVLAHGELVNREVHGEAEPAPQYATVVAPGRLLRHARGELDLAAAEGLSFEWIRREGGVPRVRRVDVLGGTWRTTAELVAGEWTPVEPPEVLDTAALGHLHLWSDELGGQVGWVHGDPTVTWTSASVVDHSDALFAGGATEVALEGWLDAPRGAVTAAEAETGDVFLAPAPLGAPHRFLLRRDDLGLFHDPTGLPGDRTPAGLAPGEVPGTGPYTGALLSGPLLPAGAAPASPEDSWRQAEFFTWESGANPWNRTTGLVDDAGDAVRFDEPLRFLYVHSAEDDRDGSSDHAGRTFLLEYAGPGRLLGIPQEPVDLDLDGVPERHLPLFSLADGALLGPAGEYLVKALELEPTLVVDPAGATALSLVPASDLVLPDEDLIEAPGAGARPAQDAPPRVVDGRVLDPPAE